MAGASSGRWWGNWLLFRDAGQRSLTDSGRYLVGLTLVSMFVAAVFEWQVPEEPIDVLDLAFRLERRFGVRISRDQLLKMGMKK